MHRLGFRFRLHEKRLPGKPDLVFPRYKSVIFVHGCFWHGHECSMFKWPKSRAQFWRTKIEGNKLRDQRAVQMLEQLSWRYLIVWECEVKNKSTTEVESRLNECSNWLIQGIKENETIKL
jgi:DNA mismatch endonuclease (patch repair protein)